MRQEQMTKKERISALLNGQPVDHACAGTHDQIALPRDHQHLGGTGCEERFSRDLARSPTAIVGDSVQTPIAADQNA